MNKQNLFNNEMDMLDNITDEPAPGPHKRLLRPSEPAKDDSESQTQIQTRTLSQTQILAQSQIQK
jgi:hypothetical protein